MILSLRLVYLLINVVITLGKQILIYKFEFGAIILRGNAITVLECWCVILV